MGEVSGGGSLSGGEQDLALDLLNQARQVGLLKTDARRRNPVMLDVRKDMFVMGVGRE